VQFSSKEAGKLESPNPTDPCIADPTLPECVVDPRTAVLVQKSITVNPATNKADILFVVDNSGSMGPQIAELGRRFPNFIASLAALDWQICVTTTDIGRLDGRLRQFPNGSLVITKSTANVETEFLGMMSTMGSGNGDERAILAINRAIDRNEGCFRSDAALNTVILSDEDERSTGGYDEYKDHNQFRVLEPRDLPNSVFDSLAASGRAGQLYTNHSIIIRPMDTACFTAQANENPAFYGTHYAALTNSTKGALGDICATDYGAQVSLIGQNIVETLGSVALECAPVDATRKPVVNGGSIITSALPAGTTVTLTGNKLNFTPALPGGTVLSLKYYCLR
jgi:hypothetical protein